MKERPVEEKKIVIQEIEWKDITDPAEVIKEYPEKAIDEKEIFDVLCVLPFSGVHQMRGRSLYAGIKMAAESMDAGINLRITTFDMNRLSKDPELLRKVLSVPEFDLVIAPYSTLEVNKVGELTQGNIAAFISPWNTSPEVRKFPGYVQLNPGLNSHFEEMVDWTAREYGINRTLVVGLKKDARLVEMLQSQNKGLDQYYTSPNPRQDILRMTELIKSKDVQAIIIPSWRSSDEAYFLSLLSAINAARDMRNLSVFVLSSWMNYERINYDQFNGLNLNFTSSRFLDVTSRAVQRFEERYINRYHYFASEDVYYGHDVYLMLVDWFAKYQRRIRQGIINYECKDCFFRYDFVEKISEEGQPYISNDHVDILSFKNFDYHRVN